MTTAPVGFEPSLQALQPGGGPAVVRWQTAADGGKNSRGGGETLTGDFSQLRQPFDAILAGLESSHPPLQTPSGLDQQHHRKSGAVVVNSGGGESRASSGDCGQFRQPK